MPWNWGTDNVLCAFANILKKHVRKKQFQISFSFRDVYDKIAVFHFDIIAHLFPSWHPWRCHVKHGSRKVIPRKWSATRWNGWSQTFWLLAAEVSVLSRGISSDLVLPGYRFYFKITAVIVSVFKIIVIIATIVACLKLEICYFNFTW